MSNALSTSDFEPGTNGDLLNQVLSADVAAVPKISVPWAAFEEPKKQLAALRKTLTDETPDLDLTYHVTSEEVMLSATKPGLVTVVGPRGALLLKIDEPEVNAESSDDTPEEPSQLWKVGISVAGTGAAAPPEPQVTMGVFVGGGSAKIGSYLTSPRAGAELDLLGINVFCIIKNGGASILTTIVSCLPSLAGGPAAFMAALTASLGAGSVDLITKIMACF
jgi:hypothetical protein